MDKESGCCLFCGVFLPAFGGLKKNGRHASNKRVRSVASLKAFVLGKCKSSPYLYNYFAGVEPKGWAMLCLACMNWQRRMQTSKGRRGVFGVRPWLVVDQFTSFVMQPGRTPFPDKRCIIRLVVGLRRVSSINLSGGEAGEQDAGALFLLRLMPLPVQVIISMLPEDIAGSVSAHHYPGNIPLMNVLLKAWWSYNNNSVFFAHHMTAKLIRRMVKDQEAVEAK